MSRNLRRKRVSPKESVEGPDVKARSEANDDLIDEEFSPAQRKRRPKPSFPTGAQLARKVFSPRRKY